MPFSEQEFFSIFAQYNQANWPMPIVAYVMGVIAVGLLFWNERVSAVMIPTLLAGFWAINGVGYHATYFALINPLATLFAGIFILQALLLGLWPLFFGNMHFRVRRNARSVAGLALIVFAMLVYPVWGRLAGHSYPAIPVFGLAPCPTTIFTVGCLLFGQWRKVRWLLVIPAIWAAIGGSAAILLGVPQDWGLIATLVLLAVFAVGHWRGHGFALHRSRPVA